MRPALDSLPCITTKALFLGDRPSRGQLVLLTTESAWCLTANRSTITAEEQRHTGTTNAHRSQRIIVVWKLCGSFGSPRPLMACPKCGRHSLHLYLRNGNFLCRRCTGAIYRSQMHGTVDRLGLTIERLQRQLAPASFLEDGYSLRDIPPRPKGMHSRTYQRLVRRLADYQWRQDEEFLARLRR